MERKQFERIQLRKGIANSFITKLETLSALFNQELQSCSDDNAVKAFRSKAISVEDYLKRSIELFLTDSDSE